MRQMSYPMRGSLFVPAHELDLIPSRLNANVRKNWNNHHYSYNAKTMARFLITQTFRDLERNQEPLLRDFHQDLHDTYLPPRLPGFGSLMEVIDEAYQNGERLRYGSANSPQYANIDDELYQRCENEYNQLNRRVLI